MVVYHIVDHIADGYLDLINAIDGAIDELEENVDVWPNERTRARVCPSSVTT